MVQADFEKFGLEINEETVKATDKDTFKKLITTTVWNVFFLALQQKKLSHIKVKDINYGSSRVPQKYFTNPKFDNVMRSLLFNLNSFQDNFHTLYGKEPLFRFCLTTIDSQEHSLTFFRIKQELSNTDLDLLNSVKYSDLF